MYLVTYFTVTCALNYTGYSNIIIVCTREWIEMEIRRGSTSQQILMRAAKALFENQHSMGFVAEKPNRDHYITHDDISNVKRLVDTET